MPLTTAKQTTSHLRSCVLLTLICMVLELMFASNIQIGLGHPNFMLIALVIWATQIHGSNVILYAALTGLFVDLNANTPLGMAAFAFTVAACFLVQFETAFAQNPVAELIFVALSIVIEMLVYHLLGSFVGVASSLFDAIILGALPSILLTFICYLPIYALTHVLGRAHMGTHRNSGSHFSTKGLS